MFMAAMVGARHNPVLMASRNKLVAAGKPKLVALLIPTRKLLTHHQRDHSRRADMAEGRT